ncbi:phosphatase PAP2 family protein [Legionella fairfieldensis]|uniref:phosphatase PAP2 family protein n=1 Tax=Legionella fairfieldensis TaxID=45064 RepID=UPI00068709D9|nr:phosphatase PAP2 family protein [Legionella fairfieldensis]
MSPFDRLLAIMTKPFTLATYAALVALSWFYLDKPLAYYLYSLNLKANLPLLSGITKLGMGILYLPVFFILAIFFRYIRKEVNWESRAWFLFMCVAVPSLICGFLKLILGRARPSVLFNEQLFGFYGFHMQASYWSFPSGHTTTITGAMLGLGIVFPRYFYTFLLIALSVSLSRVLLTNHYLSDVLVAGYLVLIEVGCLLSILRRKSWLVPVWRHDILKKFAAQVR